MSELYFDVIAITAGYVWRTNAEGFADSGFDRFATAEQAHEDFCDPNPLRTLRHTKRPEFVDDPDMLAWLARRDLSVFDYLTQYGRTED